MSIDSSSRSHRSPATVPSSSPRDASAPSGATSSSSPSKVDSDKFSKPRPATLSPADTALIAAAGSAKKRLYVQLPPDPSSQTSAALIAAAARGVDVRVVMSTQAGHDKTWMLQQHLESSGVEVDVRSHLAPSSTLAVADQSALVLSGDGVKTQTGAAVEQLASQLSALLDRGHADVTHNTLLASGKVELHPMPESSSARIVQVVNAAKKSIDLELYQLEDPDVVHALSDAAKRGVAVRVMLEPKTVGGRNYDEVSAQLKAAGINVQPTPPQFDGGHNVDHAKFMIVDGKELLFGTGNLVRSGLGGDTEGPYDNRDFWVEDARTPSIGEAQKLFDADWNRQSTSGIQFDNLVVTPDNADSKILSLIDSAKKRLYVYNQELEDPAVLQHLLDAKKRGVDVQVLLGYQPSFGGPPANSAPLKALQAAGVKAAYLERYYLHAKGIVADDRAYLGSQNFVTNGGLGKNREVGEIFDDASIAQKLADTFLQDAAHPELPKTIQ